ncbi:MAG: AsmA-like C-terminal region-containing protein [Bacteroidia bacterium]
MIKKILLTLLALLLLLVGTLVYTVTYRKQEIISYVLAKLNEQLNTPVKIDGVDLTLLSSFPQVTVVLTNVRLLEVNVPQHPENLAVMQRIELGINAWDIINKKYSVQQIKLLNGNINLKILSNQKDNFHFWKQDTSSAQTTTLFELKKLTCTNVELKFKNYTNATSLTLQGNTATLSGVFSKQTTLDLALNGELKAFAANDFALPRNKKINVSSNVIINNTNYTLNNTELSYAGIDLLLNATIKNENELTYNMDINSTKSCSVKSILQLLPNKYATQVASYEANGDINFKATINKNNANDPSIKANITARNASITEPNSNEKITNINIDASYDNLFNNGYVNCTNIAATLGAGNISGNGTISNFDNAVLITHLKAQLNLDAVKRIAQIDTLQQLNGTLATTIHYEGPLDIKTVQDYNKIKILEGNVNVANLVFQLINDKRIIRSNALAMQFNNTDLVFKKLPVSINNTNLDLSGELKNILPFILGSSNNLEINASLNSNNINMDDILNETKTTATQTTYNIELPANVTFNLVSDIKQLKFGKLNATNIKGDLHLKDKKITTNAHSFNTCNGTVMLKGSIDNTYANKLMANIDLETNDIDMKQMFVVLNNFGQTFVTDANVAGNLSTNASIKCTWNNALKPDVNTLYCTAVTTIDKGQLTNFDPLKKLSRFIDVNELSNIKFSQMNNTIYIKNGLITMPQMDIKSSLLDITASGTHSFDNKIDYHFSLLLNDLLAKKARVKKENNEFGEEENDGLGKLRLFISMKGTTDKPVISYDRKGLQQKLKEDFAREKQNLKTLLKQEFGLFKKDSTLKVKTKKQTEIGVEFDTKKQTTLTKDKQTTTPKQETKTPKDKPKWLQKDKEKNAQNTDEFN